MSAARVSGDGLGSEDSRVLEVVERFEDAWQAGHAPDLDRFCPPAGDPERPATLAALVQVDLERRLKAGEAVRVEGYLQRYPELAAEPDRVLELLATEYEQRRRRGPDPDLQEYDRRWPQWSTALRRRLPLTADDRGGTEGDAALEEASRLLADQCQRWQRGEGLRVEVYLQQRPDLAGKREVVLDLISNEVILREERGETLGLEEYLERFPQYAAQLPALFAVHRGLAPRRLLSAAATQSTAGPEPVPPSETAPARPLQFPGYEVLGELGRGGMGIVYQARQVGLNRLVALKMILAGAHAGDAERQRFHTEAEAIARLQHPNIVQIHEVGDHQGQPYLALELCPGGSLEQKLHGTPLPPREAAALVEVLTRAVHAAHERQIVHRDLKPANVLLTEDGTPKVTDFGVARKLDEAGQTASGAILGTPSYMAPEQAAGCRQGVGPAADVYALGAILYECLTGRPPFKAATPLETVLLVLNEEPVPPRRLQPKLPRDLETICFKCLHKEPKRRYVSAEALANDLQRFLGDEPITARPASRLERGWRWCRRHPAGAAAATLSLLLLATVVLVLAAFAWSQAHHARQLAEAQGKTLVALDGARQSQRRAEEAERAALRQTAATILDRAVALCQQGEEGRGLLWLARGLELARKAGDADLEAAFRWNLGAWAAGTHELVLALDHPGPVRAVALSPDGQLLAAGGPDGGVRLWRTDTGAAHGEPLAHPAGVNALAFSPDGHTLLTGCADGAARLWDCRRGAPVGGALSHYRAAGQPAREWPFLDGVSSVAVSPDGKSAVTGGCDGTLRLWSLPDGRLLGSAVASSQPVFAVAVSPDGSTVLSGGGEWQVGRWDARSLQRLGPPLKVQSVVWGLAFTPDSRTALVGVLQQAALLRVDLASGKQAPPLKHRNGVFAVACTRDGQLLVSGGYDEVTRLWDAATGKPFGPTLPALGWVRSVAVSRDGRFVAVGSEEGAVRLWRLAPGAPRRTVYHPSWVRCVAFTPDGRYLLAGNAGGVGGLIGRWEVATGRRVQPILQHTNRLGWVHGLAVSPDGTVVYTADCQNEVVHRWETATGKELGVTGRHGDEIWSLALSPDGRRLLTGSADYKKAPEGCSARLWDAATGAPLGAPMTHTARVFGVAFSPDGKTVLTGSHDRTTRLWDAATGQPLGPSRTHAAGVWAVAFHPDGKTVLTGGSDRNAQRWDLEWRPLGPPLTHDGEVTSVGFTRDARLIVTTSTDGTARLWHPETGKPVGPLLVHGGSVNAAVCAPDGETLATCSDDGAARLWALPGCALAEPAVAERQVELLTGLSLDDNGTIRVLTSAEWRAARAGGPVAGLTTDRGPARPDTPPRLGPS